MNALMQIAGPFLGMGGGYLIAAGFIALLRLARGESIRPRPLRPLPYPPGPEFVVAGSRWCLECCGPRVGRETATGFTCPDGHHTPTSGAITVETPAPSPSHGTGAGTTQEGAL